MTIKKMLFLLLCCLTFAAGASAAVLTAPKTSVAQGVENRPPKTEYRTYRIDFNGKNCEFCGVKAAEWYEFSARKSTGGITRQYLCTECREICRYK